MSQPLNMQAHEKRFHDACNAINEVLIDAAYSLHTLQTSRSQMIRVLSDQIAEIGRVMKLAKNMVTKNPLCVTILSSAEGYFQEEFQDICFRQILPALNRAMKELQTGDQTDCQVSYAAANQLESAQEKLEYALESRE
jgi:hypothetical protein